MKKVVIETETEKTPLPAESAEGAEPITRVDPAALTPDQVEQLKQRAAKAEENWDRLVRTTADFDNYKKRAVREKTDAVKFANEALLQKLIPVIDSFEMAVAAAQNNAEGSSPSLLTGVKMVQQLFKSTLQEAGLEEVDASGTAFDPNLHEAVAQQESAEAPEGQVIQQLRKGYKLRERLLRPATVIVAKPPAAKG